ncbi:MAG: hypothetical protein GF317_13160 [Candidatus Lokiarchaeota archaeon]|nr:hypothetical protein [Candidatus Lokiarchaeota archaeon]MBD3200584.1 hypothetical protein [Candidatus Lokiarchaeota archaeon]
MLFQLESSLIFILGLIIGTILLGLIIYIVVILIESKHKASDKVLMIFLLALIAILILPPVLGAIGQVLGAIGNVFAGLRSAIDGGGDNYVTQLVPIIGFLILLILTKFFIDIRWETAVWISLVTLFFLYILLSLIPELDFFGLYVV